MPKLVKNEKAKEALFYKLRNKGIFWSYSKDMRYEEVNDPLFIEYILKYGDFDDIRLSFRLFDKKILKNIWEERLTSDRRFIKLNLLIARVFFKMDVERDYFEGVKNARFEKLKLLAS